MRSWTVLALTFAARKVCTTSLHVSLAELGRSEWHPRPASVEQYLRTHRQGLRNENFARHRLKLTKIALQGALWPNTSLVDEVSEKRSSITERRRVARGVAAAYLQQTGSRGCKYEARSSTTSGIPDVTHSGHSSTTGASAEPLQLDQG